MPSILIAGSGGQGILFFGKLIAQSAMNEGKNVTWFPSYGAEMRGGTANCTVQVSDEVIGSPIVRNPDILIVLNKASMERFGSRVKKNGLLIMDSSLIKETPLRQDIGIVKVPASDIAVSLGNAMSANMVLLGALIKETGIVNEDSAINALEELTSSRRTKTISLNKSAIKKGLQYNQ
ncbi:MAG: 2-oxoacid:acceptor oxidoreductase family protein [Nitrospirae bacterium]|nr:2-oxoacid:acceptor oxidoreductase family protein [Nitrospirota bacterium]